MDGEQASVAKLRVEDVREYIADMASQLATMAAGIGDEGTARALTAIAEGSRTTRGGVGPDGPKCAPGSSG